MPQRRSRLATVCQQALAVGTVLAVTVPAMTVVSLDIVAPEPGPPGEAPSRTGSLVASEVVDPEVTEVPVDGVEEQGLQALTDEPRAQEKAEESLAALSAPEPVRGYATVGVTWDADAELDEDEISLAVRSLDAGQWSEWEPLEYHDDHNPDPDTPEGRRTRPGTDALIIGDVDEVQVKAVTETGAAPEGMKVAVVDPGESEQTFAKPEIDTAEMAAGAMAPMSGSATTTDGAVDGENAEPDAVLTAGAARPSIYSRKQWGANERLRDGSPRYGTISAGFVHHTVNGNGYTRDQVPSLIRGIYAYHTQSRGWSDIGYNFIVDKFGRIWEGRYGGVDRPVVGAHTLNYNQYSFAMSALGNFETARPSSAMLTAYGKLMAWKLGLHGVNAADTSQRVGSRYFKAISGHRDAGSTACPGRYLYAQLPTIRSKAASYQTSRVTGHAKKTNLSGSAWPDFVVREKGSNRAYIVRTEGYTSFGAARVASSGWGRMDTIVAAGDLNEDGRNDIWARNGSTGVAHVYPGTGRYDVTRPIVTFRSKFKRVESVVGALDMNSDGRSDLVARDRYNENLYLYPGRGNGTFRKRRLLATGWGGYNLTVAAGDLTGDRHNDIVARSADGRLWLFAGNGAGRISSRRQVPGAWGSFDIVAGAGDLTGDGRADLLTRQRRSQVSHIYPGTDTGRFEHRIGPFTGFKNIDFLASAGQLGGHRYADLIGRRGGDLVMYGSHGHRNIGGIVNAGVSLDNTNLVLNVGDWDSDGIADMMTRAASNGRMYLRRGLGANRFAAPALVGSGWNGVSLVAAVGDVNGDKRPDLVAQPRSGSLRVYPSNGSRFQGVYAASPAISGDKQVGVGMFNSDSAPDTVVRRGSDLYLHPGNGYGGFRSGTRLAGAAARYDWLIGIGDADGNRHPDALARQRSTGDLWLLPGTGSGFGQRRFVAGGFGRFDLAG